MDLPPALAAKIKEHMEGGASASTAFAKAIGTKAAKCPECKAIMSGGKCPKCGYSKGGEPGDADGDGE